MPVSRRFESSFGAPRLMPQQPTQPACRTVDRFPSEAQSEARQIIRGRPLRGAPLGENLERKAGCAPAAAILAADVVGYSRLMQADEVGTLEALKAHRHALVDRTIA